VLAIRQDKFRKLDRVMKKNAKIDKMLVPKYQYLQ
jgi:hypothetical protein